MFVAAQCLYDPFIVFLVLNLLFFLLVTVCVFLTTLSLLFILLASRCGGDKTPFKSRHGETCWPAGKV